MYVPAAHAVHIMPLGPVYPALQMQSEAALLPVGELLFAGQPEHTLDDDAPIDGEYLPSPQSVQLPDPVSSL